jgi:flagellar basal-body rod protein FlgB
MNGIFGIHEQALKIQIQRAEMIANNIVNVDTPGFKAKDLNFREILASNKAVGSGGDIGLRQSQVGHQADRSLVGGSFQEKYRLNLQPTLDGNTVDMHVEKAEYMKNAQRMQATLRFLEDRVSGLKKAFRGS